MHHVHDMSNGGTRKNNVTCDRIRSLVRNCCIAASVTMVTDLIVAIFSSFKRSGHFFGSVRDYLFNGLQRSLSSIDNLVIFFVKFTKLSVIISTLLEVSDLALNVCKVEPFFT